MCIATFSSLSGSRRAGLSSGGCRRVPGDEPSHLGGDPVHPGRSAPDPAVRRHASHQSMPATTTEQRD